MYFGEDVTQLAFIAMVVVAVGGVALALFFPMLTNGDVSKRVKAIADAKKGNTAAKAGMMSKLMDNQKDNRRKQVQESLKQIEERAKQRKKRMSLRMLIMQSGLDISLQAYWIFAVVFGAVLAGATFIMGLPWYV